MKDKIFFIIYFIWNIINKPLMKWNKVTIGKNVKFRGKVYIKTPNVFKKKKCIIIGDNVNINSSYKADPIGGDSHTILYVRKNGRIKIENGVGLSNTTIVSENSIIIGEYTNIGGGSKIYDTDFHSIKSDDRLNGDNNVLCKPVIIGKRVFIGGHCIILKGVNIGDDAVIGAGSIVTHNVPQGEIWGGNPAKCIGKTNY